MCPVSTDWPSDGAVEVVPAYEAVAKHLRRAIHLGELPPGSKLPAERTLSAQLGVSRITLRDAIRMLEGEGYVEVGRGSRGTFVHSGFMEPEDVQAWMRKRWKELEGLFDFRLANERCSAERAASRVSAENIEELREMTGELRESEDVGDFRKEDLRFHIRIADLAESDLLRNAVEEARAALYVPFRAIPLEDMRKSAILRHSRIIDALEAGDPRRAGRAMETHLNSTAELVRLLAGNP